MRRSGWLFIPAAFFLFINFSVSSVSVLFFSRFIYFLFLVLLFLLLRRYNLDTILPPIVGGISGILFLYGILQKFVLFPFYLSQLRAEDNFYAQASITRIKTGRIFSLFALPTLYAIICAVLILFILHYMIKAANKKNKIAWGILLSAGLFNLVLTQSFGGVVYLSVGLLVYLLLSRILHFKYLGPALMVLSLFLFITVALRFSEARELEPVKLRVSNWAQAVRIIDSSPFWGVGLGNYENKISYYTLPGEARSIYAHNFFLQFTGEAGIVISCIIILFLFLSRKKLLPPLRDPNRGKEKIIYITVFFILLVYNAIDIGFYFFSAGIAAAVVLSQLYRRETAPAGAGPRQKFLRSFFQKATPRRAAGGILVLAVTALLMVQALSDNYRKKADFFLSQKEYGSAERYYKKSIAINPLDYKSMTGCAYIHSLSGSDIEEERYLEQTLKLYPASPFANFLQSKLEFKRKRYYRSFYHAAAAYDKNRRNNRYKKWYLYLKANLEASLNGREQNEKMGNI
jgi:tetratricopeptide (TPR) repeat protein